MRLIDADALKDTICSNVYPVTDYFNSQDYGMFWTGGIEKAIDEQPTIESAQPDIIHCKDCKHWMPYDWMFSEVWQSQNMDDYPENEIGCVYCDRNMGANDFCSKAEMRNEEEDNEQCD